MAEYPYYERFKESLEQAVAFQNGDKSKARVSVYEISVPEYNAEDVLRVRSGLRLSQRSFALALGVSPRTVEAWEIGRNTPAGSARNLMYLIERDHSLVDRLIARQ